MVPVDSLAAAALEVVGELPAFETCLVVEPSCLPASLQLLHEGQVRARGRERLSLAKPS